MAYVPIRRCVNCGRVICDAAAKRKCSGIPYNQTCSMSGVCPIDLQPYMPPCYCTNPVPDIPYY